MRLKLIYFAYPYSQDPKACTEEIKKLVAELAMVRQDFVPIVPHIAFDELFEHPEGYDPSKTFVLQWEFEIISRCDYICFSPTDRFSVGCIWEREFANWIDVPIVDYWMLLQGESFEQAEKS